MEPKNNSRVSHHLSNKTHAQKFLIIGSGPAGATCARVLADAGHSIDLYEKRNHVAGNCYDQIDTNGALLHSYGPHYFRTNAQELITWLSRFTDWTEGKYFVRAWVDQKEVPIPLSLASMEAWKGGSWSAEQFSAYLQTQIVPPKVPGLPAHAEEQCLATIGKEIYEKFFKNYTIKQWGVHPRLLDASVTARIPLRMNHDTKYPVENFQFIPQAGYTAMFKKILDHSNINLFLNTHLTPTLIAEKRNQYDGIIYSGPIDYFYSYCYGHLAYRSLHFEWRQLQNTAAYLKTVQLNYPNDHAFTRVIECKHLMTEAEQKLVTGTTICYEYPMSHGEPFYPMPTKDNQELYLKYKKLADHEQKKQHQTPVYFLGRLAEYRYYNMDQIFLKSLNFAQELAKKCKAP